MAQLIESDNQEVKKIIQEWKATNTALHKDEEMRRLRLPQNPEYVYRLEGSWTGWNDFLDTPKGTVQYLAHEHLDLLESLAFKQLQN